MSAAAEVRAVADPPLDTPAWARRELLRASAAAAAEGMPGIAAAGQLIRPLVALAAVARTESPPPGFWAGVLAIQLAHEASLAHDDILDGATLRRGEPTLVARAGIAGALVHGDHLLTAAYRAAAGTGSLAFITLFARAVERTVAGEAQQGRSAGMALDIATYEQIALGKAGELLGCALALAPALEARADTTHLFELGRRIGLLYQMLDDLLDYCPAASTGKPALADYGARRWTWLLADAPELGFGRPRDEALAVMHGFGADTSPARRALRKLERIATRLRAELAASLPNAGVVDSLIGAWVVRAREAVEAEALAFSAPTLSKALPDPLRLLRDRIPAPEAVEAYLAVNSRSFRFASRFFPAEDAGRVARVYAFCRITDDLVDRPGVDADAGDLLERWLELSRRAYDGHVSGLPLLDRVMTEMGEREVPFVYAAELVEGMRMDLRGERYDSLGQLRRYTYRVASVVGLWLTRLAGVHDPWALERAARMGHAMQLTNILRDVGEDWRHGRLYLPTGLMNAHGVLEEDLSRMAAGGPIVPAYREMIEELMRVAEEDYRLALEAVPVLPPAFRRPVAIAAYVYRGIHREIRRRGYDNLRQRAYTAPVTKAGLAVRALWALHRAPLAVQVPVLSTVTLPAGEG